ncbi:MAG: MBL fold metallo-hydrolase [Alphaproteobacteria bacterium]|nr:MBL fold metallo-hydrolase [Alphaproteobacteria bacterium]
MKRILQLLVVVLVIGLGALAWTFTPATLPVPPATAVTLPPAMTTQGVEIRAILAGKMMSRAGMAYRGGSMLEERVFGMGGILVQHPRGTLLFDTGFGSAVDEQFKMTPWLMQETARYEKEPTVAAQLQSAGISPSSLTGVVLTHAHWDHVSGLVDLPGVPVFVPQAELDFINSGDPASALARQIGTKNYQVYDFDGGPYLGFEKSHDFFGDGSVVVVPAPGHTPGSIFAFITTSDGRRYALIGDTAWQSEGVDLPAEKPWLSRTLVDTDPAEVRALLIKLHQLKQSLPNLIVVPAHDRRVWETLPRLGAQ